MDGGKVEKMLNPWIYIWTQPRQVISQQLQRENREKGFIVLAVVIGMISMFANYSETDRLTVSVLVLQTVIGGALAGVIGLYFMGWFTSLIGKWIGGKGSASDLRVAQVRGALVPMAVFNIIRLLIVWPFVGETYFIIEEPMFLFDQLAGLPFGFAVVLGVLFGVMNIYLLVIHLKSIGEAHGFSAWAALGVVAIQVSFGLILFLLAVFTILI